jgi:hypothetical protein
MKKFFGGIARIGFIAAISTFTCLIAVATSVPAAQLKEARVTQVINDVKLLPGQAAPRPAAVNDPVRDNTAVRTGTASRSELTFTDLTITRLGANTIFSFNGGTRDMTLTDGAILFQVPKGSGGATIRTAAVTAAITGTTGVLEFHPATATHPPISKCLCLEGHIRLYLANGQSVELGPGKMTTTDGTTFAKVMDFDIGQFMATAPIVIDFETELASAKVIAFYQQQQENLKLAGGFIYTSTANFLNPENLVAIVDQGMVAQGAAQISPSPSVTPTPSPTVTPTPTVPPSPTPSKFGTPSVITSSDPYIIDSDTVIQTDPSITNNGVTDFGKIYRGPQQDGAFSVYAFGSTSAFDTASDFDTYFGAKAPIAAFKFQSLQLIGNPMIDTTDGATDLALIGVSGITSGAPGGTLTFSSIGTLLLATQSGSINLSADLTFDGLALFVYARGANSTLTFDSFVSNTTDLYLHSEGDLQITDALAVIQENAGQTTGLNISLRAGETINVGGNLSLTTDASDIQTGGNIFVMSGGDMTIGGAFTLSVAAASNSTTGTGGNITVNSGGSLTAGSLNFDLFFDLSDGVTDGENLSLSVAGNLTTTSTGGVNLRLSTPVGNLLSNGGNLSMTVGGNLNIGAGQGLNMTLINTIDTTVPNGANLSGSIGGDLSAAAVNATLDNSGNGGIGTGGNLTLDIGGSANSGVLTVLIDNSSGGQIGTGGNIVFNIGGDLTADSIDALINNRDGGSIGSGGNMTFDIGGSLTTVGDASFVISNRNDGSGGGTIGSQAVLNLITAGNLIVGGNLTTAMSNNGGGQIAGSAFNDVLISGDLTTQGFAFFTVDNTGYNAFGGPLLGGGNISQIARVALSARNVSVDGILLAAIRNRGDGQIGGDAIINFVTSANLTVGSDALFSIENTDTAGGVPGSIDGNASLSLSSSNVSVTGALSPAILNHRGGNIGGDASILFNVSGAISSQSAATFDITNFDDGDGNGGGTIAGNASIGINAGSFTANSLLAQINNSNGGSIGGNATINMNVSGSANVTSDATFDILGSDGAAAAAINFNGGSYDAGGQFLASIDGNGAITFNNASVAADVLKAGAFGTNGVLNIGGGTLSADTTLQLYASGSNGQLNFVSDVTLGGNSRKILAADAVTIFDDVVVTINGPSAAEVYTNNANYTGSGGNNSTTGTFGGSAGANNPQPLDSAPPFDAPFAPAAVGGPARAKVDPRPPSSTNVTSSRRINSDRETAKKGTGGVIKVSDSGQLLSLLDRTTPGPGGRITIPASNRTSNGGNSGRLNAAARLNADRGAVNIRSASSLPASRLP